MSIPVESGAGGAGTAFTELSSFGLLRFAGSDAQRFLHAQLSCDVVALQPGQATYGSYSTPQGRMLASFVLWRDARGYLMQLPHELCAPVLKRLSTYILRAMVKAHDATAEFTLIGLFGTQADRLLRSIFTAVPIPALTMVTLAKAGILRLGTQRFELVVPIAESNALLDVLGKQATRVAPAAWDLENIRAGIPVITQATQEQFVPQMANLDLIGGVSFNKGCYPGQEIVARMHFLGKLKQRMYLANVKADPPPQPGDKLYSGITGDQSSGMIVNAAPSPGVGYEVLAVLRTECAAAGDAHLSRADDAALALMPLPYKIPNE
jgi:tRNA-modifying protein YgfZ